MIRWDGVQDTLEPDQYPTAELVSIDEIEERIPGFRPVTRAEREKTRAGRREHLQRRAHR